jgi:hypothetical protein
MFENFRQHFEGDEWDLAVILLRLLSFEALHDSRCSGTEGTFRWLPVLRRLLEVQSPSHQQVARLLEKIKSAVAPAVSKETIARIYSRNRPSEFAELHRNLAIFETLSAVECDDQNLGRLTRDYVFCRRSFRRDLLALRYFLGDADFAFIQCRMWTSPEEGAFSWWDKTILWFSRKYGGSLTA